MLKLVGDINFTDGFFDTGFGVGSKIREGIDPFEKLKREKSDIWIGNFECVCADTSNKTGLYRKQFITSKSDISHLSHLDIYNVANNHVMQHGSDAYQEMLQCIDSLGSGYFGADSKKSHTFKHQGKTISILGFCQRPENFSKEPLYWAIPEYSEIASEYNIIRDSDIKIAYIHWGNEFINYPYLDQKSFAHWLIDLGFDIIIGMHPHILQGFEIYKDKYIFYSLGNFVFNMPWYKTHYSAIVSVDLSGEKLKVGYDYVHIDESYCPSVVSRGEVPSDCTFEHLNKLIENIPENEIYYSQVFNNMKQYRTSNYKYILKNVLKYNTTDIIDVFKDFVKRKIKK